MKQNDNSDNSARTFLFGALSGLVLSFLINTTEGKQVTKRMRQNLTDVLNDLDNRAQNLKDIVEDQASEVKDRVEQTLEKGKDYAENVKDRAETESKNVKRKVERKADEVKRKSTR